MKIAVIGAGSWGTAISQTLANAGHEVCIYARKQYVADIITTKHFNPRYLSNTILSTNISASSVLKDCLKEVSAIILVTPSNLVREFAKKIAPFSNFDLPICVCSKGVEGGTGSLLLDILEQELGNIDRLAVLSGPNHAEEVILEQPSGTVIASPNTNIQHFFQNLFTTDYFRCYTSDDYIGVQLCAAFKNVIAIAVGVSYGIGYGDNTAAMLMTRGMAEMTRLVESCGGSPITVMGLAGAGDLIATCTSKHSRNRSFGYGLANGETLKDFEEQTHMVVEGALACKTLLPLAEKHHVELPISQSVRELVWGGVSISVLARELISRSLKPEFWGIKNS